MAAGGVRAGKAFVEVGVRDKLQAGLARAGARLRSFGTTVMGIGGALLGGAAAIGGPLLLATKHFLTVGDQMQKMSARTGFSTESLSQLGFAAEQSGTDVETLEKGIMGMQRGLLDAGRGLSTATDNLADLGLNLADLQGMAPEDQFKTIAQKISEVADPSQKAALAMKIFGKSGQKLVPLLAGGRKGIEELQAQAEALGLTVGGDAANNAAALTDSLNALKRSAWAGVFAIGGALAPVLLPLVNGMVQTVVMVANWIRANTALVVTVAKIAAIVAAVGFGLVALGAVIFGVGTMFTLAASAVGLIGTVFSVVAGVVGFILSPMGLLIGFLAALTVWAVQAAGGIGVLGQFFGDLWTDAMAVIKGIGQALVAGDVPLAMEILKTSLLLKWETLKTRLATIWAETTSGFRIIFGEFLGWFQKRAFDIAAIMAKVMTRVVNVVLPWIEKLASVDPTGLTAKLLPTLREIGSMTDQEIDAAVAAKQTAIDEATAAKNSEIGADLTGTTRALQDDLARLEAQRAGLLTGAELAAGGKEVNLANILAGLGVEIPKVDIPKLSDAAAGADEFGDQASKIKGSAIGTFSAAAAAMGLTGSPAEETAKNTAKMARIMEREQKKRQVVAFE